MLGRSISALRKQDLDPDLWSAHDVAPAPQRLARILDAISAPAYTSDVLGSHSRCCLARAMRRVTCSARKNVEVQSNNYLTYTSDEAEAGFMAAQRKTMDLQASRGSSILTKEHHTRSRKMAHENIVQSRAQCGARNLSAVLGHCKQL